MKEIASLGVIAGAVICILGVSLGGHVYRWQMISWLVVLIVWVGIAWYWHSRAMGRS